MTVNEMIEVLQRAQERLRDAHSTYRCRDAYKKGIERALMINHKKEEEEE